MRLMRFSPFLWVGLTLSLCLVGARSSQALTFNFVVKSGGNLAALQSTNLTLYNNVVNGFGSAGSLWSSLITDAVTVNVQIDFPSLGSGILGQASSASSSVTYAAVRSALQLDASSADDAIAVANLQSGPSLSFVTNNTVGTRVLDNNASNNNTFMDVNRANLKALGLIAANDATNDADIEFSSNFTWDFDRSNGITGGTFDFVGVAAHEIGHAMGFVSGVDSVDFFSGPQQNGSGTPQDLNGFAVYSVLDLYRYSTSADTLISGNRVLDLAYGGTPAFALDRTTPLGAFSTGSFHGDGWQASHWVDGLGIGIMDPTFAPGELGVLTTNDQRAMDAIGWNLAASSTPEPGTVGLVLLGGILGVIVRRRYPRS